MAAVIFAIALSPEPPCRSICAKEHTELRVFMRPAYDGSGRLESDILPTSVCDEYQEVCQPDAAAAGGREDLSVALKRSMPPLDDEAMVERIKAAADRDDARSVERRCGRNAGADTYGRPRYPKPAVTSSPELGGNPPPTWRGSAL